MRYWIRWCWQWRPGGEHAAARRYWKATEYDQRGQESWRA